MKKTIIFAAFAALVLASSCSERVDVPELAGENVISLDLIYGDPATRADDEPKTTPGEGLENSVTSVQYFFYNDVTENPIYNSGLITNPTISEDLKYSVTLVAGENGVPDLTTMFKNGTCTVFGVFNAPAITDAPLATVKQTTLSNTFAHQDGVVGDSSGSDWVVTTDAEAVDYPKYFVMAGELALTRVSGQAYAAKGTVEMNRVAAKIAVDLKIQKSVTVGEGTAAVVWNPMLGGKQIRVYPNNMVGNAVLGGASTDPSFPTDLGQFSYKEVVYNSTIGSDYVTDDETGTYYVIKSQQDFYTYPIEWTRGGDDEPFIKIIVPWRSTDGTTQKEIYYKVMLPMESIEANKYYKLTVVVSLLGTEGEPEVTLEPLSALVVNWQGGAPVNGTISAAKYLSVERGVVTATSSYDTAEGRFDFYTETSGTDFAASDPVTVRIKEIKQKNLSTRNWEYLYQNGAPVTETITSRKHEDGTAFTVEEVENWVTTVGDNYLQFGHQLNSDMSSKYMDVTPYYYTVVLSLPDAIDPKGEYDKTVTFVQWPEIYVVADPNSNNGATGNAGVFVNDHQGTGNTYYKGYYNAYNRRYQNYNNDVFDLGNVRGITSNASNRNPNMYVLTISVASSYIIGDPRESAVNIFDDDDNGFYRAVNYRKVMNWASGRWTEDPSTTSHTLTYYHPASSQNTSTMIAPKIRVASSYGVCSVGRDEYEAKYRCASYQEDGIPAGRWRLPTMAEVQFISKLSALGRIPYLFGNRAEDDDFNSNSYYWTANGLIRINNGANPPVAEAYSGSSSSATVRCVYDEWFWGDATASRPVSDKTLFTWGDRNY